MKIGASTLYALLSKKPVQAAPELAEKGFRAVEVEFEYPHYLKEKDVRKLNALGLDYSMHCPYVGIANAVLSPRLRRQFKKIIAKSLDAARKIGATHYVMHGGAFPQTYLEIEKPLSKKYFLELFAKEYRSLFERASDSGVKTVFENLGPRDLFSQAESVRFLNRLLAETGFCLDVAHAELYGNRGAWLSLGIDYAHASDNNLKTDEHLAVGEGKIDWRWWLNELKKKSFGKNAESKIIVECLSADKCVRAREALEGISAR